MKIIPHSKPFPVFGVVDDNTIKQMSSCLDSPYAVRGAIMGKSSAVKDFQTLTKANPKRSFFIARLSRRNGPIKIDWEKREAEFASGYNKYKVRNAPFFTPHASDA